MRKIIIGILITQLLTYAQQAAPATDAPKGGVKFEITSQLVVVNVSAKGKDGASLDGLKASDFTVTEDGKTQQIKVFEYQRMEDAVLATPDLAARDAAAGPSPAVKSAVAMAISPGKAGELKYKDRRLLVLFFDQAGMPV